jgi:hypothetical protein
MGKCYALFETARRTNQVGQEVMLKPTEKQPGAKVLEFNRPRESDIDLDWILGITRSNERLIRALERLRAAHIALLLETNRNGSTEVLSQAERVLREARQARNLTVVESSPDNHGA